MSSYKIYTVKEFSEFPDNCVFAIYSDELKLALISESEFGLFAIARHLRNLRANPKLRPQLDLHFSVKILSIDSDKDTRMLQTSQFMDEYRKSGYKLLSDRKPLNVIGSRISYYQFKYFVYLITSRQSKIIVGVFSDQEEAKKFYKAYYHKKVIKKVIIYDNELTRIEREKQNRKTITKNNKDEQ
jgi:hypothetical protein